MKINDIIIKGIKNSEKIDTPSVIYLKDAIRFNIDEALKQLSEVKTNETKLLYSIKACYNSKVISLLSRFVAGFSVSSVQEYKKIARFNNKTVSATGFDGVDISIKKGMTVYYLIITRIN